MLLFHVITPQHNQVQRVGVDKIALVKRVSYNTKDKTNVNIIIIIINVIFQLIGDQLVIHGNWLFHIEGDC